MENATSRDVQGISGINSNRIIRSERKLNRELNGKHQGVLRGSQYLSRLKKLADSSSQYTRSSTGPVKISNDSQVALVRQVRVVQVQPVVTEVAAKRRASSSHSEPSEDHVAFSLLRDIHDIFDAKRVTKLRTTRLLAALCSDHAKQWASLCEGGISARRLNTLLKRFGLHSRDIRFKAGVFKGFERGTIAEAWDCFNEDSANHQSC